MFVSNKTVFLKKEFLGEETNVSEIELGEVHEVKESAHIESDLIRKLNPEPVEAPLRRFSRVPYQLDRYYNFLIWDGDPIELDENDKDPITYMEAMQ